MVEYGGISCIWFLVAGEIHVDAREIEWPCDAVFKLSNAGSWHVFKSSMLLLMLNLFQIPTDGGLEGSAEEAPMVSHHMAAERRVELAVELLVERKIGIRLVCNQTRR